MYSSWVWMPLIGAGLCSGKRASMLTSARRALLSRAHELGDVLGQRLGLERRLAEDDLADRLVDDLLEPRHVRALLVASELDHALEARREQLLGAVLADADHLLHAGDADAREAELDRTARRALDVGDGDVAAEFGSHGLLQGRERGSGCRLRAMLRVRRARLVQPSFASLGSLDIGGDCGITPARRIWETSRESGRQGPRGGAFRARIGRSSGASEREVDDPFKR